MNVLFLKDMFLLHLPVIEKIARPIVVYLFLITALRLAGKREVAQLNPFDLVVLLTLSNTVQNAIIGEDNSVTGGLIGAATLLIVNYIVVRFLYSSPKLDRLVEGSPEILVENGIIFHKNLKSELITVPELESAAHRQGFVSLDEVDRAILEPGGSISFCRKQPDPEIARHQEIISRMNKIESELSYLKEFLKNPK